MKDKLVFCGQLGSPKSALVFFERQVVPIIVWKIQDSRISALFFERQAGLFCGQLGSQKSALGFLNDKLAKILVLF